MRRQANRKKTDWFGEAGLILNHRLEFGGYHCTPRNTLQFAHTGGDGIHFSFVIINDAISEESPVVMTIPEATPANMIVGESLFDFLCFGMHRGYFELLSAADPTEEDKRFLEVLTRRLKLKPWKSTRQRLSRLREKYYGFLKHSFDELAPL